MKKNFKLTDPKIAPARQVEAVKFEIRKYLERERRKPLKDNVDYWDFDCRIGHDANRAEDIHVAEINKGIDRMVLEGAEEFYMEILAKPGHKKKTRD